MKTEQNKIDYIIDRYVTSRKNTCEIAEELGMSGTTVSKYLKENGVQLSNQKYKFNEYFFREINSSDKAYFLGLIYADGCVYPKKNSLAIKLTKEDEYILEEFKKSIESNKPLYQRKSEVIKGTQYIGKAQAKIELNSKILIEDLKKLGVVQNKSLILDFPAYIPKEYMSDFIRGYFDGDGCIYNSQNRIMINIVGSENFCKGLCLWLEQELNIKTTAKQDKRGKSWYLYIMKIKDVLNFCNYIYQDGSCLKLIRKYSKFKEYERTKNT